MLTVLWTVFAVAAMLMTFAACAVAVVVGIRLVERLRAKRLPKQAA